MNNNGSMQQRTIIPLKFKERLSKEALSGNNSFQNEANPRQYAYQNLVTVFCGYC